MREPESVYPSRVDAWLVVVLAITLVSCLYATALLLASGTAGDLLGAGLALAVLAVVLALIVPTRYTIRATELEVRGGVLRIRIPLERIRRVYPSRSWISSPALSLDRLAVEYGAGRFARPTVYISPVRRDAFLRELGTAAGLVPRGRSWVRPQPEPAPRQPVRGGR